jgi:hypothetical protein
MFNCITRRMSALSSSLDDQEPVSDFVNMNFLSDYFSHGRAFSYTVQEIDLTIFKD